MNTCLAWDSESYGIEILRYDGIPGPEECLELCAVYPGCTRSVWATPGHILESHRWRCWLKDGAWDPRGGLVGANLVSLNKEACG